MTPKVPEKPTLFEEILTKLQTDPEKFSSKPIEIRKNGYRKVKEGGLECFHRDELKCQEGIVIDLMASAGKQLMEGKNVVGISLPVRIFEPRSTIERICDWWAFAPIYLKKAGKINDNLERFKLVMTFAVSGLYNGCKQMKPFNPILGETFQGSWPDGSQIYVEHSSHHPPISHFLMIDSEKLYQYFGYYEYKASLKGNALGGKQDGPNYVKFKDGQLIKFSLPPIKISGLLWGRRIIEWYGAIEFKDEKNDLYCKLKFYEPDGYFSKRMHSSDYFEFIFSVKSILI